MKFKFTTVMLPVHDYSCMKAVSVFLMALFTCCMALFCVPAYSQVGVTRLGTAALANNSSYGSYNTGLGYYAMNQNVTGTRNTATGYRALNYNVSGSYNSAFGKQALYYNRANYNTGLGYEALYSNTSGDNNTGVGASALRTNNGSYNTATGYSSLFNNSSGNYNTAAGALALTNSTRSANTAFGHASLTATTTGSYNTAVGYRALSTNTAGNYNTAIGYYAAVTAPNLTNATAIGHRARVDASNKVRIGDASVTSIGGQVSWTTFSDGRYKNDVKENVAGLSFINSLRPVTYKVNVGELSRYYGKEAGEDELAEAGAGNRSETAAAERVASSVIYSGFIAQEVEQASRKLNFEFSGVDKPQSSGGLYGLRYDNFIAPLVKAVQELSVQNEALQERLARLEAKSTVAANKNPEQAIKDRLGNVKLEQNVPNPFRQLTVVRYDVPEHAGNAVLSIADNSGRIIRRYNLVKGKGFLQLDASAVAAGVYNYYITVNGRIIESKKMEIIK